MHIDASHDDQLVREYRLPDPAASQTRSAQTATRFLLPGARVVTGSSSNDAATSIFRANVKRLTEKGVSWPIAGFPTALDDAFGSYDTFQARFAAAANGL